MPGVRFSPASLLLCLALIPRAPAACAASAKDDSSYAGSDLRPSTAAPWNPPQLVAPEEAWESWLRLPLKVLSHPLSLLGDAGEAAVVYAEDHALAQKAMALGKPARGWGLGAALASHGEGTGLGAGIGWTPPLTGHHLRLDASASTSQYSRVRLGASAGPWTASYTNEWRPREPFFGIGGATPPTGRSNFAQHVESLRLGAGRTWRAPVHAPPPGAMVTFLDRMQPLGDPRGTTAAAWIGPVSRVITTGRDRDQRSFEQVHPRDAATSLHRRVEHLVYGVRVGRDEREGIPHWTQGWRASVDAERYDRAPRDLALADAGSGARSFTRLAYRAEAGTSFGRDPRTLRLLVEAVDTRLDRTGGVFTVAEYPTLGGPTLAGYMPGRFRDADLVHARLTYLWPLARNLEFDLHAETGGVYPGFMEARFRELHSSGGGALRGRTDLNVVALLGVDRSREETRFHFAVGRIE